jgi:broad specificity phosphatase PhoE
MNTGASVILSSPFKRCVQTAEKIASTLSLPIEVNLMLCEFLNPRWFNHTDPIPTLDAVTNPVYPILEEFGHPAFPECRKDAQARYTVTFGAIRNQVFPGQTVI